jgi:hypothetical protein
MQTTEIESDLNDALWKFLMDIQKNNFFGIVEFHFQNGKIVRVKKQEVFEPKDLLSITVKQ